MAYALSYWRTIRKIVEEPDIVAGSRRLNWLPLFGGSVQTAIVQFSIRTLARSRQHRMILAFYLGIGLAFTSLLLKDPTTKRQFENSAASNPWREVSFALWMASVMMMVLAMIGTRVVFALPLDLRANWIFRITGVEYGRESLAASRRAMVVLAVLPVWLAEALVCGGLWPAWQTAVHLVALGLLGMIVAELCLIRFRKIPFACSYLPGKSPINMVVLGAMGLVHATFQAVRLEQQAVRQVQTAAVMVTALVVLWIIIRLVASRLAKGGEQELRFDDELAPVVQGLGLTRDGVVAMEPNSTSV